MLITEKATGEYKCLTTWADGVIAELPRADEVAFGRAGKMAGVARWLDTMAARPAVKKGMAVP